jgi:peptidoglycan/xylan/chitin deacetylase (PgdA/CDA1 family)
LNLFAFTLDLEPDYAGIVDQYEIFKDLNKIEEVLKTLRSLEIKITVFALGEIFEKFPGVIKLFEKYDCEFEPHSYSHNFNNPDSEPEIKKARTAYFNYFNKYPKGYRAPRGKISYSGIKLLEKYGFSYDSSIFPSYFPNPFRYLFFNKQIHYYRDSKVMEIPLTTALPSRLTLSLSYLKLFGINFFIYQSLPGIICFDSHLHDFIFNENSYSKLSPFWKFIYRRNKTRGTEYCLKFLRHIKQKGYEFCYMSEIYESFKKTNL